MPGKSLERQLLIVSVGEYSLSVWIFILLFGILANQSSSASSFMIRYAHARDSNYKKQVNLNSGILDHIAFIHSSLADGHPLVKYIWKMGERNLPMVGAKIVDNGKPFRFMLSTHGKAEGLTLVLREFRTVNSGGIAYLVNVNGRNIAFRNEQLSDAGPTTAFIDIPSDIAKTGKLTVILTNVASAPVQISEATLYENMEAFTRKAGMIQPLTVYITGNADPAQLQKWRSVWQDQPDIRLGVCYATFPIAQWPPEQQKSELQKLIACCQQYRFPLQVDPISWWGGTPSGCDGLGGQWNDVTYQQVTYSPSLNQFGLSIPNVWSNTPWLTMGNPRLNAFRSAGLQTFGSLMREAYLHNKKDFPVKSIVVDNEPTYWVFYNPGGSPFSEANTPDAIADFNPSMVAAARMQGVNLDPHGGLKELEKKFLRNALTSYDHEMHSALQSGLGDIPLSSQVYTHAVETTCNGIYSSVVQDVGTGVLRNSRLGVEDDPYVYGNYDQFREIGIPSSINVERGGESKVWPDVENAFAAGCNSVTLFNPPAEAAIENIRTGLKTGWQDYLPQPWRQSLYTVNFRQDHWLDTVPVIHDHIIETGGKLLGDRLGQDNILLVHLRSQQTIGKPQFGPLVLSYKARAFVFQKEDPNGFLAVSAGVTRENMQEVSRLYNNGGITRHVDLTSIAKNSSELWVQFTFHPLGLTDWVNLFSFSLDRPWSYESLNATNRSYRAERLRAESSIAGWRADAAWSLRQAASVQKAHRVKQDNSVMAKARKLFAEGYYPEANALARQIGMRNMSPAAGFPKGWGAPASDRVETGELRAISASSITIDPYQPGFSGRIISIAPDAHIDFTLNGTHHSGASWSDLKSGDDVQVHVRNGLAAHIQASRGSKEARIADFTSSTPFAVPTITLVGQPARPIGLWTIKDSTGKTWIYQVGALPLKNGEMVNASWNPRTGRLINVQPVDKTTDASYGESDTVPQKIISPMGKKLTLKFNDEFNPVPDKDGKLYIDQSKWQTTFWQGSSERTLWGNLEAQYYTDKDYWGDGKILPEKNGTLNPFSFKKPGILTISAWKVPQELWKKFYMGEERCFASGLLISDHRFDFKYGYVEGRFKLPANRGAWPAFWLLGDDPTKPTAAEAHEWGPEVDIFEFFGHRPTKFSAGIIGRNDENTIFTLDIMMLERI
jgi:hypothetical protein